MKIESWKKLEFNSEKMTKELFDRVSKIKLEIEKIDKKIIII